jgi:hypothetical protein
VTRNSSGNYACSALNSEGETISNQLSLRVKCKHPFVLFSFTVVHAFRSRYLIMNLPLSELLESKQKRLILISPLDDPLLVLREKFFLLIQDEMNERTDGMEKVST